MARALTALVLMALALTAPVARAQPEGDDDSAALIASGRRALDRGDLDDAARALDQALALNPRRIEAYVLRATIHLSRSQLAAGIALLRRAQALAPDNLDVATLLGTMLLRAGDATGAPMLAQVVARDARRFQAHAALGRYYLAALRWRAAIASVEAYLATRPARLAGGDAGFQTELAEAYLRAGEPRRASALFQALLVRKPDDARARMGAAWAAAAVDCRAARGLLTSLLPSAPRHPEVWLVAGRCALATGNLDSAARQARLAIDRGGATSIIAAGHALAADVAAAGGDLDAAAAALAKAHRLEPADRRWSVRQARLRRRGGDARGAVAALDALGPPASPELDPAWWRELGEALLAAGAPADAIARLSPVADALPRDASVQRLLGEAHLAGGDSAGALPRLEAADALASTPRTRAALGRALDAQCLARLDAGDDAGAERRCGRAAAREPSLERSRNHGAILLAMGRSADAAAPLERAARSGDPVAWMLLARVRAGAGDAAGARVALSRAAALARGDVAFEVARDAAAFELDAGAPGAAVAALERADRGGEPSTAALRGRHRDALATARHALGVQALRRGDAAQAVAALTAAAALEGGNRAIDCDLAIATVAAGDRDAALRRLRGLGAAPCPFAAPADAQAIPILIAAVDGLRATRADVALDRLGGLEASATGAAAPLRRAAVRAVALGAADDAYRAGRVADARRYLAAARRAGADEAVAVDAAVLDVADGRLDAAIAALDRLAPRWPEALISLGVAWDRKGQPARALEAWQRARKAGVRFAPLADWIMVVEQLWGAP